MTDDDQLTAEFEASRPRLRALAYRMLGSHSEADDAVQETWLRLQRAGSGVDNLGGWLTTVIARVCLDRLRSRRARPEVPVDTAGHDLPFEAVGGDPADQALLAESIGAAMLVVLELLPPAERVAFVLHDVEGFDHKEVGRLLGIAEGTSKSQVFKARMKLRALLRRTM